MTKKLPNLISYIQFLLFYPANMSLPRTPFHYRGFTLIELMVVIAIIAILAVVGFSVFQNAQANAKDGIRRGEINNLAKSIESTKDPTTSTYTYTSTNFNNDFPTNKPTDPFKSSTNTLYCLATSASAVVPNPTTWAAATTCPSVPAGWATFIDSAGAITPGSLGTGIRYWKICARLQVPGTFFCQGNLQ